MYNLLIKNNMNYNKQSKNKMILNKKNIYGKCVYQIPDNMLFV